VTRSPVRRYAIRAHASRAERKHEPRGLRIPAHHVGDGRSASGGRVDRPCAACSPQWVLAFIVGPVATAWADLPVSGGRYVDRVRVGEIDVAVDVRLSNDGGEFARLSHVAVDGTCAGSGGLTLSSDSVQHRATPVTPDGRFSYGLSSGSVAARFIDNRQRGDRHGDVVRLSERMPADHDPVPSPARRTTQRPSDRTSNRRAQRSSWYVSTRGAVARRLRDAGTLWVINLDARRRAVCNSRKAASAVPGSARAHDANGSPGSHARCRRTCFRGYRCLGRCERDRNPFEGFEYEFEPALVF